MFTYSTWSRKGTKVKLISCSGGHTRQSDDIGEEREGEKRVRERIEGMEGRDRGILVRGRIEGIEGGE